LVSAPLALLELLGLQRVVMRLEAREDEVLASTLLAFLALSALLAILGLLRVVIQLKALPGPLRLRPPLSGQL